jgi:hypothetical protein
VTASWSVAAVLGSQLKHIRELSARCEAEQIEVKSKDVSRMRDGAAFARFLTQARRPPR